MIVYYKLKRAHAKRCRFAEVELCDISVKSAAHVETREGTITKFGRIHRDDMSKSRSVET